MDENALIQDALKGEVDAFNRLVLAYQDLAFNVAYRMLADEDLAADAVQNAFISAYRNLRSYRGGSFKAWFLRIVTNACYDELRKRKRRPTIALEPETDDGNVVESPEWLADTSPSLEEKFMNAQLEKAIQSCLNNLDEKFKAVIVMVDISGQDYETVADAIQTPVGTVKSRLSRARLKMQECLRRSRELLPTKYRLNAEDDDA